ncbi:uncharacterized protein [Triticum aestivum]|uniref:Uncharacterized protein n=1 Tax=Aegilops tauschii subsp. strangulata TaxID=200361 RepID=A0A453JZI0_AEGTS|nr:uncharacterized protein LOC123119776 [Triticum aestivum]XP_045084377.1 uncharacterized protein LOC109755963 isoform X1 [Aegilops tauschii subsp. strangulata]
MRRLCSSRPSLPSPGLWLPLPQDLCASRWKIREGRRVSPTASLLHGSFAFLSKDQVEKLTGENRDEAYAAAKIMKLCAAVGDGSSTKVMPERPPRILRSPWSRPSWSGAPGSWPPSWCWARRRRRHRVALRCPAPWRRFTLKALDKFEDTFGPFDCGFIFSNRKSSRVCIDWITPKDASDVHSRGTCSTAHY